MKPRPRIYIDTSVIGGCLDDEFKQYSEQLFRAFIRGTMTAVVSDITLAELLDGPEEVRRQLNRIPRGHVEYIQLTEEAAGLANKYVSMKVVHRSHLVDAQHIALATVGHVDVLVSWNFKHIVNIFRIHGFNSVNIREKYHALEIRTPMEVLDEGQNL
jgi:hypothetical protein